MLEEFESYFDVVDVKELKEFLKEAKEESEWIKSQGDDSEATQIVKFMTALLENIEHEIQGVQSLASLDFKSKVRLYSMVHLFHDLCGGMDDEFEDFEFDEDYEEDDNEDNNNDNLEGKGRIIKLE